jgi:hypothetical protein
VSRQWITTKPLRAASTAKPPAALESLVTGGTISEWQPYLAIGYDLTAPLHESCGKTVSSMAKRCLRCRRDEHGQLLGSSRSTGDAPLRLFFLDPGGMPTVMHEACWIRGPELLPDGSVRNRCTYCRRWSDRPVLYDVGGGVTLYFDPECAAKLGAPLTEREMFVGGFRAGVALGALASIIRGMR